MDKVRYQDMKIMIKKIKLIREKEVQVHDDIVVITKVVSNDKESNIRLKPTELIKGDENLCEKKKR